MGHRFGSLWRIFTEAIYPSLCPVCGERLVTGERVICVRCRWDMPLTDYWTERENPLFRQLEADLPGLQEATALFFFRHESHYRTAIHQLKYNGRRDIARSLGELLGREMKESGRYHQLTVLIPVPLHWSKRIRRGYNQAEEICRGMSRSLGIPVDSRTLRRVRRTRTQALHRTAQERHCNVEGAFALRPTRSLKLQGAHVLLVDDVLTTGATLKSCATAIHAAHPEVRISVATLAVVKPKK